MRAMVMGILLAVPLASSFASAQEPPACEPPSNRAVQSSETTLAIDEMDEVGAPDEAESTAARDHGLQLRRSWAPPPLRRSMGATIGVMLAGWTLALGVAAGVGVLVGRWDDSHFGMTTAIVSVSTAIGLGILLSSAAAHLMGNVLYGRRRARAIGLVGSTMGAMLGVLLTIAAMDVDSRALFGVAAASIPVLAVVGGTLAVELWRRVWVQPAPLRGGLGAQLGVSWL